MIESSPRDQVQPKLQSYPYLKPGDEIPLRKPRLFDADGGKPIPVSDDLFPNPWDVTRIRWDKDSARVTFLYNQRGHQVLRVVAVDASTGGMYKLTPEAVDASMQTRTAVVDGRRTIQVAVVMSPDPSWEKIGQLSPE